MRLTFLLPPYQPTPSGGFIAVYQYANALVARGHAVRLVYPGPRPEPLRPWFALDPRVELLFAPGVVDDLPNADAIFNSPYLVSSFGELPAEKGLPFILVLGYAVLGSPAEEDAAWKYPSGKVMIAEWLREKGRDLGIPEEDMVVIPNAIEHETFRLLRPIEGRPPRVAFQYHPFRMKGAKEGFATLALAREQRPDLQAAVFGTAARPERLPPWVEYYQNPPRSVLADEVYNGSSIFLCASKSEGFHLPSLEAMACDCAVVSTDIGGVRDFAQHERTALISPPVIPDQLARDIVRLCNDDELRVRLAVAGRARVDEFRWERSAERLERFVSERIARLRAP